MIAFGTPLRNIVPRLPDGSALASSAQADSRINAIRRLPLFAGVPSDTVATFVSRSHWRTYAAGEVIVDSGETSDQVFFIIEGAVRVVARTAFGYEAILNDLAAGTFFGELAAIDGVRRSANVTALVQTKLFVVPGAVFMELAYSSRQVADRLLRLLVARLRAKDERLIEFSVLSVRQRLIAELLRLSRDRGGGERVVSPPLAQHVLAARIGTRRESVSRELGDMARAGLLTVGRGAIVLHHPAALRQEVEASLQGPAASPPQDSSMCPD
jgi:CRP-like cAMP-binding protein